MMALVCVATFDASAAKTRKGSRKTTTAAKPVNLVNETYVGEGNGGGMYISTTINFMADGKCKVSSNFHYGTDIKPFTVNATYTVSGRKVTVTMPLPDERQPLVWKFTVSVRKRPT